MQVELHCPSCVSNYESELDNAPGLLDQLAEEGPWLSLGDGATFEDELSVRLGDDLECPCCGGPVQMSPTSLGRLSLQLLTQW